VAGGDDAERPSEPIRVCSRSGRTRGSGRAASRRSGRAARPPPPAGPAARPCRTWSRRRPSRGRRGAADGGAEEVRPRVVRHRQAEAVELLLEHRAVDAGLHGDGEARLVDLEHAVHAAEVDGDPAVEGEGAALRAGPAAARDDRHAVLRRDPDDPSTAPWSPAARPRRRPAAAGRATAGTATSRTSRPPGRSGPQSRCSRRRVRRRPRARGPAGSAGTSCARRPGRHRAPRRVRASVGSRLSYGPAAAASAARRFC
jgi:hypothetical protein